MRSRWAGLAAAVTTAAGLAVTTPAAQASGTTMLSGSVVDGSGAVSGATVTLVAWPDADYLNAMADGATVPLRTVSTTSTASDGSFSLSPDLSTIPAQYTEPDGAVNFDVNVSSSTAGSASSATYLFSGADVTAPAASTTYVATTADPMTTTIDVADGTATYSTARSSRTKITLAHFTSRRTGASLLGTGGAGCATTAGAFHRGLPEKFMRVYALNGAVADVTETSNSSHSLGIGVKVGNDNWHGGGSTDMDTELGGYAALEYNANRLIFNRVDYRDFNSVCNSGWTQVQRRGVKFAGLQNQGLQQAIDAPLSWAQNRCQLVNKNSDGTAARFAKTQGSNGKFTAGIDLGPISVESQAGFSHNTEELWIVRDKFQLCSSNSMDGWLPAPQAAMLPRTVTCNTPPCPAIATGKKD